MSYVLENRNPCNRVFPEFFTLLSGPADPATTRQLLRRRCCHAAPRVSENPVVVLLTPGIYNSAFFEHSFLAREMGVDLVEGAT